MRVGSQSLPKRIGSKNRLVPRERISHSGSSVCSLAQVGIKHSASEEKGNTHPGQDVAEAEMSITKVPKVLQDLFSLESVDQGCCKGRQT